MKTHTVIKGFKDILPDEAVYWQHLESLARDLAKRYDFHELRPPIAEKTEVFARGIGDATDIVEKEMYTFCDKGEEKISLRPEATAGMVRAVLEHHLTASGRAARLFCFGPMFRYERPQKGRQRQFHQLDMEIIGDPGPEVDAELLAWLTAFLRELGLTDLTINLNSLGCPNCRPAYRAQLVEFFTARKDALCSDCQRRLDLNPLRIIDCKNERCHQEVLTAPQMLEHLCLECEEHLSTLKELLAALDLKYVINPHLVRGLDYYTRTAFEIISNDLGAQSALAGGGRYDGLCRSLGGDDIPGIGFAMGLERLVMLLKEKAPRRAAGPDYYVAILTKDARIPAMGLVEALRKEGHSVATDWAPASLKSRLKRADKMEAREVIILGEDELAKKTAIVRHLGTHEQKTLDLTPYL